MVPSVTSIASGTQYAWSDCALNFLPGTTYTFTITGTAGLVCVPTTVSNTAFVVGTSACSATALQTEAVGFYLPAPIVNIEVVKNQTPATLRIGELVTYQIVVTNTGAATLESLVVIDTVSPVLTGVIVDQPAGIAAPVVTSIAGGTR